MTPEVLIVGGGVMGCAIAWRLVSMKGFAGRVTVVERDRTYATAASALSTSGFRQQFSTPANVRLSQVSIADLLEVEDLLAVDGERPGVPLHRNGYLYLGREDQVPAFEANNRLQRALGVEVDLVDRPALAARFPWLSLDDIAVGSLGHGGEGWTDGYLLMSAFRRAAVARGARVRFGEIASLTALATGGFLAGLADGARLRADIVVDCAGTRAPQVSAMVGVRLPIAVVKQTVFHFEARLRPPHGMPFLFTPDGLFLRPEGEGFLAGVGIPPHPEPVALDDFAVQDALFEDEVWPRLARRVADFEALRLRGAWAGHYDLSLVDRNPFLGETPVPGFLVAAGFSGHGLMQAFGVSLAMAELIAHGACRSLDLSDFALGRADEPGGGRAAELIQY